AVDASVPELVLEHGELVAAGEDDPDVRVAADRVVDPALARLADSLRVGARREPREAVRPELERKPGEHEADGDERRKDRRVPARQPQEARCKGEREKHGDDSDAVAARPRVTEEPTGLEPDRVRLRGEG